MIVSSKFNAQVGAILHGRSYWAVKLKNGDWLSELDEDVSLRHGHTRHLHWHDHIVANGDGANIRELWLFCPPHKRNPLGSRARLVITEPWTAFVLNGTQMNIGTGERYPTYQVIGQVFNKETGRCVAFIWDALIGAMSTPFYTSVYDFKPWREGAAVNGMLALDVLGLRLS
jgi:hypothetical protein